MFVGSVYTYSKVFHKIQGKKCVRLYSDIAQNFTFYLPCSNNTDMFLRDNNEIMNIKKVEYKDILKKLKSQKKWYRWCMQFLFKKVQYHRLHTVMPTKKCYITIAYHMLVWVYLCISVRYLRAQKLHEKTSKVPHKNMKKKDRDAW